MPAHQPALNEARCARLLRRLTSALQSLRTRLQSAPSYALRAPESKPKSQRTRDDDDDDRDYGTRELRRSALARRGSLDGSFVLGATGTKRRRTKKTYGGLGKASASTKAAAQDLSEELPEGYSQTADCSVDFLLLSSVKTVLHPETYTSFCTILRALRDILEQTVDAKDNRRPHVGVPTLADMVAGQVGAAIIEEKEEDAMDEIYQYVGDLSAGDYMRHLLRGHATEILRVDIEEGLFSECGGENGAIIGTRLVGVMVKLLLEYSAFEQASTIFEACASHNAYGLTAFNPTMSLLTTCFRPSTADEGLLPTFHTCPESGVCRHHPALKTQSTLITKLMNSEKRAEFLATGSLSSYIDKIIASLPQLSIEDALSIQYGNIFYCILLAAFGISGNDLALSSKIKRGRRHWYAEDESETMKKSSADKIERLLMSTVMRMCTITPFGGSPDVWAADEEGLLPTTPASVNGPGLVASAVGAFLRQTPAITRITERFWGGSAAYPTEAKLVLLVRALHSIQSTDDAHHPIRAKLLHKTLRIISHLEKDELITVSIHTADHFAAMARTAPAEITMWSIKEYVTTLLDFASSIDSEEIVGGDLTKTPLKAQTSVQKNLVELSMRLSMQYLTHPEWAAQDSWVAWASEIEKRAMAFGVASPMERREKAPKQPFNWVRKDEVEKRAGYRWEEGLQEFVPVGYTPVKRQRTSTSYKPPKLRDLTGGLVSSDASSNAEDAVESDDNNDELNSKPLTRSRKKRLSASSAGASSPEASEVDSDGWDADDNEEQESPISSASSTQSKMSPSTLLTPAPRSVLRRRIQMEIQVPSLSARSKLRFHQLSPVGSSTSRKRSVEDEDEADGQGIGEEDGDEEDDASDISESEEEQSEDEVETKEQDDDVEVLGADASPQRYSFRSPRVPRPVKKENMPPPSLVKSSRTSRLGNLPTPLKPTDLPKTPIRFSLTAEARLFNSRNTPRGPLFTTSPRKTRSADLGETPAPKPRARPCPEATLPTPDDSDDTLASIEIQSLSPRKTRKLPPRRHSTGSKRSASQFKVEPISAPSSASQSRSLRHKPRINYNEATLLPSLTRRRAAASPPAEELNISVASLRTRQTVNYKERLDFSDDELNASPMHKKRKVVYKEVEVAGHRLRKRRREVEVVSAAEQEDDSELREKERMLARKRKGLRCSGRLYGNVVGEGDLSEDELSMIMD